MATGGFKSSAATDFLEEWKAKREKMRAKMLGDIAAATGAPLAASHTSSSNSSPEKSPPPGNCFETGHPLHPAAPTAAPTTATPAASANVKRNPVQTIQTDEPRVAPGSSAVCAKDSDGGDSPSPSRKKSSGPRARKGKGQIEKRKLREKRRSTGVVSMPSNESLDELDDDDVGEKDRRKEEVLVQANTFQNESMTADPTTGDFTDTPRPGNGHHKSSAGPAAVEETNGNKRQNDHISDEMCVIASLEKRMEELEMDLDRERQENALLLKAHQEKDDLICKLREEIDLLNRDLDDIEDENDQLKQENKTLLKVVGQLTR
ncbi:unnamed protein product [Knipowitschia caucasica]|uniref:PRKC apoptosis WT1 regulator protein n=1 Tax=Knipowitschia caucasica TaxID=637954 RepID=A0AAV2IZD0_KNICA